MARTYEDLGLTVQYQDGTVSGEDGELRLPWRIRTASRHGERVLLLLQPGTDGADEPDFELDNGLRNVVAVGPGPTREWTIEAVGTADPDGGDYHTGLVRFDGRVITRTSDGGRFHEIDPATGEQIDSWPGSTFVVGGRRIEFNSGIGQIRRYGETTVIDTGEALHGFDPDGAEKWIKPIDYQWAMESRYGEPALWTEPRMGKKMVVHLDLEAGRFDRAYRCPPSDAKRILDLTAPSLVVSGASNYVVLLDTDGSEIWSQEIEAGHAAQAIERDGRYVVLTSEDELYALDDEGQELWRREEDDCTLLESGAGLQIGLGGEVVLRLDPATGDVREVVEGPDGLTADRIE